jgi:hypothetical protein
MSGIQRQFKFSRLSLRGMLDILMIEIWCAVSTVQQVTSMRNTLARFKIATSAALATLAGVALLAAGIANAAINPDFSNPAVAMSGQAVVASGTCIAKYAVMLDDRTKPASEIGQRVAKRCAHEISRSAGLASWMVGKPEEFSKNLRYTQDELTTNAVLRLRAARQSGL